MPNRELPIKGVMSIQVAKSLIPMHSLRIVPASFVGRPKTQPANGLKKPEEIELGEVSEWACRKQKKHCFFPASARQDAELGE